MVEANFSKYQLDKTLGTGHNSKVKLALNKENGKKYAIKIIKNTFPKLIKWLKNEYDIVRQLNHPNVIKVHEFYENVTYTKKNEQQSAPCAALVMDLIEGGDLFGYIQESGGFSEEVARKCFQIIIEVLEYCHTEAKLAHRDLKPENLLLDKDFNLMIADFGFAASMVDNNGSPLMHSTQLGTEGYKAPELYRSEPYEGSPVDVFAVGVILFAMHTNLRPFSNLRDNYYSALFNKPETYWRNFQNIVRKSRGSDFSFSEDFKKIITSMLAYDLKDRVGITEIKNQLWYQGSAVSTEELKAQFVLLNEKVQDSQKLQHTPGAHKGNCPKTRSLEQDLEADINAELESIDLDKERKLRDYIRYTSLSLHNELLTTMDVQTLFKMICSLSKKHCTQFFVSDDEYKIKGKVVNDEESLVVNIILNKVDEDVTCIEFQKKNGDQMAFYEFVDQIKKGFAEIEAQY